MCEIAAHDEIERYALASLKVLDSIAPNDQPKLQRQIKDIRISSELGIAISGQGTGDAGKAFRHAERALKIVNELEDLDPETDSLPRAICYNNMAIAQNIVGFTDESLLTWKNSLESFSKSRGSVPLDRTWPTVNSALEYCHRGEAGKASNLTSLKNEMDKARPPREPEVLENGRIIEGEERDDTTSSELAKPSNQTTLANTTQDWRNSTCSGTYERRLRVSLPGFGFSQTRSTQSACNVGKQSFPDRRLHVQRRAGLPETGT